MCVRLWDPTVQSMAEACLQVKKPLKVLQLCMPERTQSQQYEDPQETYLQQIFHATLEARKVLLKLLNLLILFCLSPSQHFYICLIIDITAHHSVWCH